MCRSQTCWLEWRIHDGRDLIQGSMSGGIGVGGVGVGVGNGDVGNGSDAISGSV